MATGQYDDAWETPGWTSQNMAYPAGDGGPAALTGVHWIDITGSFFTAEGRPLSGQLTFIPESKLEVVGGSQVIFEVHKEYMRRGDLKVRLAMPSDRPFFTYRVRQRVGPVQKEYDLVLDSTMASYDIVNAVVTSGSNLVYPDGFPLLRDYTVYQGATWEASFKWTQGTQPKDLSAWTARMQIRSIGGGVLVHELNTTNGQVALSAQGDIVLSLDAATTGSLTSGGDYDLELYGPGGEVVRFLQGTITLDDEVTV